jgi:hypothetical protein
MANETIYVPMNSIGCPPFVDTPGTSGVTIIRLDELGSVGIGLLPPAWVAPTGSVPRLVTVVELHRPDWILRIDPHWLPTCIQCGDQTEAFLYYDRGSWWRPKPIVGSPFYCHDCLRVPKGALSKAEAVPADRRSLSRAN